MGQDAKEGEKVQQRPSPLIVGSLTGSLIGMTLVILSVFTGEMFELPIMLFAAAVLGFVTGGIFASITAPFVRDIEVEKAVLVLAGGTFFAGIMTIIVCYVRWGGNAVILSWPIGILGYWFSFIFRKEIVWLIDKTQKISKR